MQTRDALNAVLINKVAEIEGLSPTSVRRIMNDKQHNEQVFSTYLLLEEEVNNAIEGIKMVRLIQKEMPFNNPLNQN